MPQPVTVMSPRGAWVAGSAIRTASRFATSTAPSPSSSRCWRDFSFFELFGRDGRYLGEIQFPPYFRPFGGGFGNVFMRDDMVLMQVEDDVGTIMVKRYRLVLPGEQ